MHNISKRRRTLISLQKAANFEVVKGTYYLLVGGIYTWLVLSSE